MINQSKQITTLKNIATTIKIDIEELMSNELNDFSRIEKIIANRHPDCYRVTYTILKDISDEKYPEILQKFEQLNIKHDVTAMEFLKALCKRAYRRSSKYAKKYQEDVRLTTLDVNKSIEDELSGTAEIKRAKETLLQEVNILENIITKLKNSNKLKDSEKAVLKTYMSNLDFKMLVFIETFIKDLKYDFINNSKSRIDLLISSYMKSGQTSNEFINEIILKSYAKSK